MFLIDFSVCASKWAVTGDDSQDLCGIEKLFYSLWKEIAGRALCLLSVPSHRESHGSGWKSLVGDRQPDPVCCWHISAGRVWAGSVGMSAQGHCACGRVCSQQTRRGTAPQRCLQHECALEGSLAAPQAMRGTKCVLQPWVGSSLQPRGQLLPDRPLALEK